METEKTAVVDVDRLVVWTFVLAGLIALGVDIFT